MGEATATPSDAINHASTHRRKAEKVRGAVMARDYARAACAGSAEPGVSHPIGAPVAGGMVLV